MSANAARIAGDWGRHRLRLFLCDESGRVIDRCEGPGVASLAQGEFRSKLVSLTAAWLEAHGTLPVSLSGMVGSREGWKEAPCLTCPADAAALAAATLRFLSHRCAIRIAPGLRCENPLGATDLMRGQETQIIGALALHADLAQGRHAFALPGHHMKWAIVDTGVIVQFQTSFTGELYALLAERSTLCHAARAVETELRTQLHREGFYEGLRRARETLSAPLQHVLFEVHTRQLLGDLPPARAIGYLSGLIVGQDVLGAMKLLGLVGAPCARIGVIGAPLQSALYAAAPSHHCMDPVLIDDVRATVLGLDILAGHA